MSLPKKIYIPLYRNELVDDWYENKHSNDDEVYVRKTELLEWAERMKKEVEFTRKDWCREYWDGLDYMIDQVIDKINSL